MFQYSERNFSAHTRAVTLILAQKTELITKTVGKIKKNEKKKKKENGTVFDKIWKSVQKNLGVNILNVNVETGECAYV